MTIPDHVRVLGKEYVVRVGHRDFELSQKSRWAESDHTKQIIDIRGDLAPHQREETFLHELIHCAESAVINEHVSEQVVYGISAALYAIFKDNGWWPDGA